MDGLGDNGPLGTDVSKALQPSYIGPSPCRWPSARLPCNACCHNRSTPVRFPSKANSDPEPLSVVGFQSKCSAKSKPHFKKNQWKKCISIHYCYANIQSWTHLVDQLAALKQLFLTSSQSTFVISGFLNGLWRLKGRSFSSTQKGTLNPSFKFARFGDTSAVSQIHNTVYINSKQDFNI